MTFEPFSISTLPDPPSAAFLHKLTEVGYRSLDLKVLIETFLTGFSEMLNHEGSVLALQDTEEEWVLFTKLAKPVSAGKKTDVISECEKYIQKNYATSSPLRFTERPSAPFAGSSPSATRWCTIPLSVDDQPLGVLFFDAPPSAHEISSLGQIFHHLELGILSARKMRDVLYHDPMTGSFNRRFLDMEFSSFCESLHPPADPFALLVLDIDHFKRINDRFGHATGDAVLTQFVTCLNQHVPKASKVIRMGGDEFLVWLPSVKNMDLSGFADSILGDLQTGLKTVTPSEERITVSMGVLHMNPSLEKIHYEEVLERVDHALYTSKKRGRNQMTLWTAEMEERPWLWRADRDREPKTDLFESQRKTLQNSSPSSIVQTLLRVLSSIDVETNLHSNRVAAMTRYLMQHLDLSEKDRTALYQGALLHDIGKLAIPSSILQKEGPLTEPERMIVRQHPNIGHQYIQDLGFDDLTREVILHHHECFDGSGYPKGLRGKELPFVVRVFSVVDTYDSMRANRVYRRTIPHQEVLQELKRQSGSQFDPEALTFFLGHLDEIEKIGKWQS